MKKTNMYQYIVRHPMSASIVAKVMAKTSDTLETRVLETNPFGLSASIKPMPRGDIALISNSGMGRYSSVLVRTGREMVDKWKAVIFSLTAERSGRPDKHGMCKVLSGMEILEPGTVCTESYLVAGCFDTREEVPNYLDYIKTRFVRFLIMQKAATKQIDKSSFALVPYLDFSKSYTDTDLYTMYGLTEEEIAFIERHIKAM